MAAPIASDAKSSLTGIFTYSSTDCPAEACTRPAAVSPQPPETEPELNMAQAELLRQFIIFTGPNLGGSDDPNHPIV
ncbi:6-hydroxy-D-nicotine oxidase [Fusarium coicis]|nr:6-hydroxy-D-nicotine oxidase [Fusarium coicis]